MDQYVKEMVSGRIKFPEMIIHHKGKIGNRPRGIVSMHGSILFVRENQAVFYAAETFYVLVFCYIKQVVEDKRRF